MTPLSRTHLAETSAPVGIRFLVLHNGGTARRVAEDIREYCHASGQPNCETFLPEDLKMRDVRPGTATSIDELRGVLAAFIDRFRSDSNEGGWPELWVHPGVGPWGERPELTQLGQELGIGVISPSSKAVSLFSNKLNLLTEVDRIGIPHLVLHFDPLQSVRELNAFIKKSFQENTSLVLKSVRSGSSGIRVLHSPADLGEDVSLWMEQLRKNFGETIFFIERYIGVAKQLFVPFVRLRSGEIRFFPFVDISLQNRHRKLIEFCPFQGLFPETKDEIIRHSSRLLNECDYVGVGGLEYFLDTDQIYFVNAHSRLNSGFHLWEKVAGTSAVAWQIFATMDGENNPPKVSQADDVWKSGLCCRILAEDSALNLPHPGTVEEWIQPDATSSEWNSPFYQVEFDREVTQGREVLYSDGPRIGTVYAGGCDRRQLHFVAQRALEQIWIAGTIRTNQLYVSELLRHPWTSEGYYHAGFVEEDFLPNVEIPFELIQLFGAVGVSLLEEDVNLDQQVCWVDKTRVEFDQMPRLKWAEPPVSIQTDYGRGVRGNVKVPRSLNFKKPMRISAYPIQENRWRVQLGLWQATVRISTRSSDQMKLLALTTGRVESLFYRAGVDVQPHKTILVLDSLGTLVPHALPISARISKWLIHAEDIVREGQELAYLERIGEDVEI